LNGGINHQFPSLSTNQMYDIAKDEWTNKTTMPYPSVVCASAVVNNRIYVISGATQIYDPKTDSWSLGTPIPTSYNNAAGATTGIMAPKRIYVIGGVVDEGGFPPRGSKLTQVYDPVSDSWTLGAEMPTPRLGHTVAVVNDQIYVIGGTTMAAFALPLNAVERYTPFGYGTPDPSYEGIPPEITLISPENKTYHETSVPLEFSVNEPVSWMRYKLDNETIVDISGNTTITGLSFGLHNLTVYATDYSDNTGASETIYFTVPEPFPALLVATVSGASVAVIGVGLVVYFKKRGRKGDKT